MKVQATNTMTRELNNFFKLNGVKLQAVYETMTERDYNFFVDINVERHENDFLPVSGKMRVIKVLYLYEDFALPNYLTTNDLLKIYKKSDKTFNDFMGKILDEIAI